MFFVEGIVVLDDNQKQFIDQVTDNRGSSFPFYLCKSQAHRKAFIHGLMSKNEQDHKQSGLIMSTAYDFFHNIFINFCDSYGVKVKTILRAAINYSIYYDQFVTLPHADHEFDHCNFIMYLTDCNGGDTNIHDELGGTIRSVVPEKYKAIIFSGEQHSVSEFEPGNDRIVLVFTFIRKEENV